MPNITPAEIESLLSELKIGLSDLAKAEGEKVVKDEILAKAHPGESTKPELSEDTSATDPTPSAPKDDAPPAPDASAAPTPDASPGPTDPAAAPAPADPAAEDTGPVDPVKLHEEYSKLSPEDLKAHYIACKAALFELVGSGGDGASPDAGTPPGADPAAPAASPPPGPDASASPPPAPDASPKEPDAKPTMKKEMDTGSRNGGPITKSEKDIKIESLEAQIAEQGEQMAKLVGVVETVLTAPIRKSIVSIADLPPSKETDVTKLSKAEVKAKLSRAAEGKLSKSDRDLIMAFDFGKINVQDVAHILNKAV